MGRLPWHHHDTVTSDGSLTITAANTGADITIGTMDGTLDAVHLTDITITDLSGTLNADNVEDLDVTTLRGDTTIGELDGAVIDTVTSEGT